MEKRKAAWFNQPGPCVVYSGSLLYVKLYVKAYFKENNLVAHILIFYEMDTLTSI